MHQPLHLVEPRWTTFALLGLLLSAVIAHTASLQAGFGFADPTLPLGLENGKIWTVYRAEK